MNFFEQELRKIVGPKFPDATYVGRSAYVRLGELNRARIQFITGRISNQYDRLMVTILNRDEGVIDKLHLRFDDLLGIKKINNPNFCEGVEPYIWDDHGKADWYAYRPNSQDYRELTEAVSEYLSVFQEQTQSNVQQWQQMM